MLILWSFYLSRIYKGQTNFSGLSMQTSIHPYCGHVAACIFRTMSTTWAPSGHQHASGPCLSPILLQRVADLLRVGYSWTELSKLATFLVCLKRQNGSHAEATTKTQEGCHDVLRNDSLLYVIASRKYFLILSRYRVRWPGSYGN